MALNTRGGGFSGDGHLTEIGRQLFAAGLAAAGMPTGADEPARSMQGKRQSALNAEVEAARRLCTACDTFLCSTPSLVQQLGERCSREYVLLSKPEIKSFLG
jgi:hypothetical protein